MTSLNINSVLPVEVTTHIFSFVPNAETGKIASVCKDWQQIVQGDLAVQESVMKQTLLARNIEFNPQGTMQEIFNDTKKVFLEKYPDLDQTAWQGQNSVSDSFQILLHEKDARDQVELDRSLITSFTQIAEQVPELDTFLSDAGFKSVDLSNQATMLRTWISNNPEKLLNITDLNLSGMNLEVLPPEISSLQNLQTLDLDRNNLSHLPSEFSKLQNLTTLTMNKNSLSSLPREITQLSKLNYLELKKNKLTSIPSEIGQLKELTYLDIATNKITSIPSEIGNLQKLDFFDLHKNQLASIPSEVGNLQNLSTLDISFNNISSLPKEISQLENLEDLDIQINKFSSFPKEVRPLYEAGIDIRFDSALKASLFNNY